MRLDLERKTGLIHIFLILVLVFFVYANALKGGFVWDDYCLIKGNVYLKDAGSLFKAITSDAGSGCGEQTSFYRPVQMFFYWVGYRVWGEAAAGYHFLSILAHLLVCLCIYRFLRLLSGDAWLAFLAALLFAVHPAHSESVAYISDLAEPLCFLFILISLTGYIKHLEKGSPKYLIISGLSFILALGSKEYAFILPFLILLYHYAFAKEAQFKKIAAFFLICGFYLLLRMVFVFPLQNAGDYLLNWPQRIPSFFAAVAGYVKLLILPFDLHLEYGRRSFFWTDPAVIAGAFLFFGLLTFAFKHRKAKSLLFFALAWFFLCLLPVSNILTLNYSFMMEHWLYIPSLGFFILAAWLLRGLFGPRAPRLTLDLFCGILIAFLAVSTARQNSYWLDASTLYARSLKYNPDSFRFHNELALEYEQKGLHKQAEEHFKRALEINPQLTGVYQNLENLYLKTGRNAQAEQVRQKQREVLNNLFQSEYAGAKKFKDAKKYKQAAASYRQLLVQKPFDLLLNMELAQIYILSARFDQAIPLLEGLARKKPVHPWVYHALAVAYYYKKQYGLSAQYNDLAQSLGYPAPQRFKRMLQKHNQ